MPNPRSRFYAMQEARRASKWARHYVWLTDKAVYVGDQVSARSHSEIAHAETVKAAHWARRWKDLMDA